VEVTYLYKCAKDSIALVHFH